MSMSADKYSPSLSLSLSLSLCLSLSDTQFMKGVYSTSQLYTVYFIDQVV